MRPFSLASCSRGSSVSVAANSAHSGWRNAALSSSVTFASSAWTAALGREDERVDLGEVAVALHVAAVQVAQQRGGLLARCLGRARPRRPSDAPSRGRARAPGRSRAARSRRGGCAATSSISTPPSRGQHPEVDLVRAVEREARVVLLRDVARTLDPHAPNDVALDVHAEDRRGVPRGPPRRRRELDAAGLAPPADLHLGLDDARGSRRTRPRSTASSTVSATPPGDVGIPNRAKYCLPWYSNRSTLRRVSYALAGCRASSLRLEPRADLAQGRAGSEDARDAGRLEDRRRRRRG